MIKLRYVKPIRTKKNYRAALERIYKLMQQDLKKDSDDYNELDVLTILVEKYEEENHSIVCQIPLKIKFRLEQLNLDTSELANILGSKSRASEILNKKRKLSISMIRTLHNKLNILASSLITDY